MSQNNEKSFVENVQVPSQMAAEQVRTMFSAALLCFVNNTTGEQVLPNSDGSVTLEPFVRYHLLGVSSPNTELPPIGSRNHTGNSNSNNTMMTRVASGRGGAGNNNNNNSGTSSRPLSQQPNQPGALLKRRTSSESRGQIFGSAGAAGHLPGQSPARNRLACTGGDSDDEVGTLLIVSPPRRGSQQEKNNNNNNNNNNSALAPHQQVMMTSDGEQIILSQPRLSQMSNNGNDNDNDDDDDQIDADGFPSPRPTGNNSTMVTATGTHTILAATTGTTTTTTTTQQQQQQQQQLHQLPLQISQVTVRRGKMIMDRVHDHIMLPPLICRIVDTPEFQRLRYLKQLGSTAYLYPGANHTRFEHSIGVSHLAGLMAKKIARRQPELAITDLDILCLMVAGLCHDLGHGPFSHLFEVVVNHALQQRRSKRKWHHEEMSTRLVRRIFANLVRNRDETVEGIDEEDINFIVLAIDGLKPGDAWPDNVGRPDTKRFLLDIVANKRNGIDVDKLDYFMRDSLACYGKAAIDIHISRLINSVRAIKHHGEWQICYEEKMALSLGDIFSVRAKLHKYAYQHRTTKVVDNMIRDALMAAEPFFTVRGSNGNMVRLIDSIDDDEAFIELSDWILNAISASGDPNLLKARNIIKRLHTRQLYLMVGTAQLRPMSARAVGDNDGIRCGIIGQYRGPDPDMQRQLAENLIIEWIKITYGSSDFDGVACDPIDRVTFFNPKGDCNQGFTLPRDRRNPLFSPICFEERVLLVMVRDPDVQAEAHECFERWKQGAQPYLENAVPSHNSPARRQREVSMGAMTTTSTTATAGTSLLNTAVVSQQHPHHNHNHNQVGGEQQQPSGAPPPLSQ